MSVDPSIKGSALPQVVAANLLDADVFFGIAGGITSKVSVSDLRLKIGVAVPGSRTSTSQQYTDNNKQFNVLDYAGGVVINTGVNDALAAILLAQAAASAAGGVLYFPPGTYKHTAGLAFVDVPVVRGVPGSTFLQPTVAVVGVAVSIDVLTLSSAEIKGIIIDGTNAPTCTGFQFGNGVVSDWLYAEDLIVKNFTGVGGVGVRVKNTVHTLGKRIYCYNNKIGLLIFGTATSLPTTTRFEYSAFGSSGDQNVKILNSYGATFYECSNQSAGKEGLLVQPAAADNALGIRWHGGWFEGNNTQDATHYDIVADGSAAGSTCQVSITGGTKFNGSGTTNKAIHFTAVRDYTIDGPLVFPRAANILLDGSGQGYFVNWNGSTSGAYGTTVSDAGGQAYNVADRLAALEAAFTDWVPAISANGTMVISSPVIIEARYKILGKTFEIINLNFTFATSVHADTTIIVSLPANVRVKNALSYRASGIAFDPGTIGAYAQGDGNNPTSNLKFNKIGDAVWALGAARQITFSGRFELF